MRRAGDTVARGLNTKVDMDIKGYNKQMKEMSTSTKNYKKQLELWSIQNNKTSSSTAYLVQKLRIQKQENQQLGRQIDLTKSKLAEQAKKFGDTSIQAERLKGKLYDLQIQQAKLNKEIRNTNPITNMLKNYSSSLSTLGSKMRSAGTTMSYSMTLPIMALSGGMANMAMNAFESEDMFEKAMGGMANSARTWSEQLRRDLGLNSYAIREQIGVLNVMSKAAGFSEKAALDLSKGIEMLTLNTSSLFNRSFDEMSTKMKSIFTGEVEPLRPFGVDISAKAMEDLAVTKGLSKQGDELSNQQKILLRYALVTEQLAVANNNLADTIDSPANKMRIMKERAEYLSIEFGKKLIPLTVKLFDAGNKVLGWLDKMPESMQTNILLVGGLAAAAGPVTFLLGGMATGLAALITPAGAVVAAIAGVTAGLVYLYNTNETVHDSMNRSWENIQTSMENIGNNLRDFWATWGDDITKIFEKTVGYILYEVEYALNKVEAFTGAISSISGGDWGGGGRRALAFIGGKGDIADPLANNPWVNPSANQPKANVVMGEDGRLRFVEKPNTYTGYQHYPAPAGKAVQSAKSSTFDLKKAFEELGKSASKTYDDLTKKANKFAEAVNKQTDAFANFGNMFDRVTTERFSPAKIQARLNRFMTMMQEWQSNLAGLEQRGLSSSIVGELRSMGPSGAGLVSGFSQMSDTELVSTANTIGRIQSVAGQEAYRAAAYKHAHDHSGTIEVRGVNNKGELVGVTNIMADDLQAGQLRYPNQGTDRRESGR